MSLKATAILIRNAGSNAAAHNDPNTSGKSFGGTYHIGQNGNSNRWESSFYDNIPGREGQPDRQVLIKISAFNGRTSPPGKGLADLCAKYIPTGKEIICDLDIVDWKSRIFVDGQVVVNKAGQPHMEPKTGYRMKGGTLKLVRDSAKQINMEVQNWLRGMTQPSFWSRPPQWNVAGTEDERIWRQQVLPFRNAATFQGGSEFGYARVEGVGAVANVGNIPVNNATIRTTEGYTIDDYRKIGWTDAAMLADTSGLFTPFIQAGQLGQNLTVGRPTGPSQPQHQPSQPNTQGLPASQYGNYSINNGGF